MRKNLALLGLAAASLLAAATAAAAERPLFKEGEIIVKFRGKPALATMGATAARLAPGASVARTMAAAGRPQTGLVRFGRGESVEAMVARFKSDPAVEYAEPNYIAYTDPVRTSRELSELRATRGPDGRATIDRTKVTDEMKSLTMDRQAIAFVNDPNTNSYNDAWFWVDAEFIWPDIKPNPMVAVIDTGVDYTHPDLVGRVVKGRDWVNADLDPMDDAGHGTHVAGIVGANTNNKIGITGVSKAMILAIKVLGVSGSGSYYDIAGGIYDGANSTARVLNLSLGGGSNSTTLQDAVTYAVSRGKLLVIAAGNDATTTPSYPAYYARAATYPTLAPNIISVGATGRLVYDGGYYMDYFCQASYSNFGDWVTFVAPGTDVYSTTPTKPFYDGYYYGVEPYYDFLSGTSMASPMVAGAAARTFSAMPVGTTAAQVKARLEATGSLDIANGHFLVDTNGDNTGDTSCWPSGGSSTPDTVSSLNVASAMGRGGAYGRTFNANGRLPLAGAMHSLTLNGLVYGFGGEMLATDIFTSYWYIVNVPMNSVAPYTVRAAKPGFTNGAQPISTVTVSDCGGGHSTCPAFWWAGVINIPPAAPGWGIVTEWDSSGYDFDQFAYTPANAFVPGYVPFGVFGNGQLQTHPYMRWFYDSVTPPARAVEYTAVRPVYSTATSKYRFIVTDYNNGIDLKNVSRAATTRFWLGGILRAVVKASVGDTATNNCTNGGGGVACPAWWVADLTATTVTVANRYGTWGTGAGGVEPFSVKQDQGGTGTGTASPKGTLAGPAGKQ